MSYDAKEKSTSDGQPFECYKFVTPIGTFRYTSHPEAQLVRGEIFIPGTILTGSIEISTVLDSIKTMDIKIPVGYEVAKVYTGPVVPEYFTIEILRAHTGDDLSTEFTVEWYGEATGYSYEAGLLVVNTQSVLQAKVNGAATTIYCQLTCNHRVYDDRCAIDEDDFTETTTVTAVDNIYITVQNTGHPAASLPLGRLVVPRTGEERTIYEAEDKKVTVTYPFLDIVVGDTVNLILGCDNRMATCIERFDNIVHFGGHKYVPLTNPFEKLSGTLSSTVTAATDPVNNWPPTGVIPK